MSHVKLLKYMVSMMNVYENMDQSQYGDTVQKSSIISLYQRSLMEKYSVFMGDYPLQFKL